MKKIASISISGEMTLNMHSLNNEGGEGNQIMTRQLTIVDKEGREYTVNGISGDMFKHIHEMEPVESKQSIATTRTFEREYRLFEEVSERITTFTVISAEKLRKQQTRCNSIIVFIETSRFREPDEKYSNSIVVKLPFATSSTMEIVKGAIEGLKKIYKPEYQYKRAGVVLMDFVREENVQRSFFFNSNPKHASLMSAVDDLNSKFGSQKIRLAVQDTKVWKMKQERISHRYTTDINDILDVNI